MELNRFFNFHYYFYYFFFICERNENHILLNAVQADLLSSLLLLLRANIHSGQNLTTESFLATLLPMGKR